MKAYEKKMTKYENEKLKIAEKTITEDRDEYLKKI